MIEAAFQGHTDIVRALLDEGADVNARDANPWVRRTALIVAAMAGHADVVRVLLENGADLNAKSKLGETPLSVVRAKGHIDIMRLLKGAAKESSPTRKKLDFELQIMELQASLASLNNELCTIQSASFLDTVAVKGGKEIKCKIIAEDSDSIRIRTDIGTAEIPRSRIKSLTRATAEEKENELKLQSRIEEIQRQQHEIGALMKDLQTAADSEAEERSDEKALVRAALWGHADTVRALLDKGVDVNTKDSFGKTALMWVAERGHTDIVRTLLAKGADVNTKDSFGKTALVLAAESGHTDIVRAMLDNGADPNTKDTFGKTALTQAEWWGHTEIVQLLKQAGAKE